ncbi:glutamate formiminotransferase [Gemmatimonadetes bacterium T265]|nr:glutamate formiminotransferase [Gemmatimonadetes bacterium T265]
MSERSALCRAARRPTPIRPNPSVHHLVECVPNFSEGRRPDVVAALRDAIGATPGTHVLDASADRSHHRSVITFVADPAHAADAAFAAVAAARAAIDLRTHTGVHPRIGAADVVPFVPLPEHGTTMADCAALAHALGTRVARELAIPVYYYERAALRPGRANLADVRRGGFERLAAEIATSPERAPDAGTARVHPTAGAVAIGARPLLVAFNVYLGPAANLPIAKAVARAVRESSGGLPGVKALGLAVDDQAQVSMNLVDLDRTTLADAFARVEAEAAARGVAVTWSELIGLLPERALAGTTPDRLRLRDFDERRILERRLARLGARVTNA